MGGLSVDRYKRELDAIHASEEFKQHTLNRLRLAQDNPALLQEPKNTPQTRRRRTMRRGLVGVSFALIAVLCWQVGGPLLRPEGQVPVEPQVGKTFTPPYASSRTTQPGSEVQFPSSLPSVEVPSQPLPENGAPDVLVDYDKSQVQGAASEPAELPVYQKPADEEVYDEDKLADIAGRSAGALGLEVDSVDTTQPDSVTADCGEATIEAHTDGTVDITFASPVPTRGATATTVDGGTLVQEYSALLVDINQPVAETVAAGPDGGALRLVNIYDARANENGSITGARMMLDDNGDVVEIHLWRTAEFEKLGDYPLITQAEATRRLSAGEGFTSLPFEFPGEEYIEAVGIEYLYTGSEEYLLPYYKFYVRVEPGVNSNIRPDSGALPDDEGERVGIWYLPAISTEYVQ